MLSYLLALLVGFGSFSLYMAAFFFPEVHRKYDFLWSGVGMFYALVLWVCAGRMTGGLLLGQIASVSLLGWFGWQTLLLRRSQTPTELQTLANQPIDQVLQQRWQQLSQQFQEQLQRIVDPTTDPNAIDSSFFERIDRLPVWLQNAWIETKGWVSALLSILFSSQDTQMLNSQDSQTLNSPVSQTSPTPLTDVTSEKSSQVQPKLDGFDELPVITPSDQVQEE